jgi:LuxR family transcriptional regulator, maltose regulon positive regulatory protein
MHLLRTKLYIPHTRTDLLERPRLTLKLNEGLKRKLILVSAPAGFGKTTLISSWVTKIDNPVAWVSLDENDNDHQSFWTYLVAALQTLPMDNSLRANVGKMSLAMLQSQETPPVESIITELLNDITTIQDDFVLILDDYHIITNHLIHHGLAFLIDNLPPNAHLVIGSRVEPPLPLSRWRVRREVAELSVDDIRFSSDEAEAFLNMVMGLTLQSGEIATLESLTEGWVAALQLAALSIQGIKDTAVFIKSFSGDNRFIFDYFAQEVLERQSADSIRFLLETSILERLTGPLCDEVTQSHNGSKILEKLEQAHLFLVPLDQKREWYRYHRLFSDFLQYKLKQEYLDSAVSALHIRASKWYENHDFMAEAVSHALISQNFSRAADLINKAALIMFPNSEIIPLLQWLKSLPEDTIKQDIRLSLNYAWALLATVQIDAVEPHLKDIEQVLGITSLNYETLDINPQFETIAGQILCIRANIASHRRNFVQAIRLSQQAMAILTNGAEKGMSQPQRHFLGLVKFNLALGYELSGDLLKASEAFTETLNLEQGSRNPHIFPLAGGHLAQLEMVQGHLHRAESIYQETLSKVVNLPRPTPLAGFLRTGLGDIYYEWNDLAAAKLYFQQGIEMGKTWNNWETLLPGYLGMVRIEIATGNLVNALNLLDDLEVLRRKIKIDESPALIDIYRARIEVQRGNPGLLELYLQNQAPVSNQPFTFLQEPEVIMLLRALLASGAAHRTLDLSQGLLVSAQEGKHWSHVVELLAIQSSCWQSLGEREKALVTLMTCLKMAEPEGFVRAVIDGGQPILKLLQLIKDSGNSTEYVHKLLVNLKSIQIGNTSQNPLSQNSNINPPQSGLIEPLSGREIEVLRLLASGKTNQEIADSLVISLNTVKTHVKNIHTKLGTRNRTEATNQAQKLGLI